MPYQRPIPDSNQRGKGAGSQGSAGGGLFSSWVQAEKMMQIAMTLPSAGFIGWLAGYGLDRWLHQTWIGTAGAIFGIIAGLVGVVRMALATSGGSASRNSGQNGNGAANSGGTGDSGTTP
jgi:hypothetical protein